ncbi:MAG TPA: choice-of-anchor Q domain-containing protein, partial [Polyangiaceae bacterium]|nr:choice-of-anchor Q domain-containing protein [Polyangiaceae bacterium]
GPASPAIDADLAGTSATFFDCPAVDQRGFPRPSGAACDIGAYEVQFAPPESFLPANSSSVCTGAGNCTVESWGVDLNADTGYLWNVDGGTGGSAELFLGVASPSGTRAMGLRVNGTQVAVISANSGASPRPTGSEFGAYAVTLNPGNNTVELVDNQGTAELDAHYLRVESSQGVCGNSVCASSESCDACSADCGQCGVEPELQFAEGVQDCTGAANCTEESWGIDLNADTGYKWTVSGGEAGGAVELFVKVAVLSGSRAMGLLVNGAQVAVVSTDSTQSPRPDGTELGPFLAMLNPGDNTVELVDNQATAEFDVHYLRVEPLPESPCSSFCSNPTAISWSGSYQSGNLGTGAVCLETTQPVAGGNCGNFAAGRQLFVNGTQMPCNAGNWTSLPASVNGGYCVQVTPGGASYAYASLW